MDTTSEDEASLRHLMDTTSEEARSGQPLDTTIKDGVKKVRARRYTLCVVWVPESFKYR